MYLKEVMPNIPTHTYINSIDGVFKIPEYQQTTQHKYNIDTYLLLERSLIKYKLLEISYDSDSTFPKSVCVLFYERGTN